MSENDLENPFFAESKDQFDALPANEFSISINNLSNLPNSLQKKYGNSFTIKWVFNQMLKMNFNHDALVSIFTRSIVVDERTQTREEILNLAIDTYLASQFDNSFENEEEKEANISIRSINNIKKHYSQSDPLFYSNPIFSSHKNFHQNIDFLVKPRHNPPDIVCGICYSEYSFDEINVKFSKIPRCDHRFCNDCIAKYLTELILDGKVLKIHCPGNNCDNELTEAEIKDFLKSSDLEITKKYDKFKRNLEISMDPKHRWCIKPGCEYFVEGDAKNPKTLCKCGQLMCFNCMNPWHEGRDCESAIDQEYKKYADKGKVKNCPKCKSRIEKNEGCNHMHCTRCKYDFCWLCNREYKPGHYEWYNLIGCPMMMYTRLNDSRFHSYILCLKKIGLKIALILGIILALALVLALAPLVIVLFTFFVPVLLYVKLCDPRKNFKGIGFGVLIFILGMPLTPFILLLMVVPGICIATCCRSQFDEIYL